jgi:EAL domain-containing protein (putative c-di-GMP-specific phosphodiesterase class I)
MRFHVTPADYNASTRNFSEQCIGNAIRSDQLILHFQPQISFRTGALVGAEALVRWDHAEYGLLLPGSFIPEAERTGQIVNIDSAVIDLACRQIYQWARQGFSGIRVSTNICTLDLECEGFVDAVFRALKKYDVSASYLCLEITERTLWSDNRKTRAVLSRLAEHGISIALDDFGTGYSNFACLTRFSLQTIKLDRSFIRDIELDVYSRAIIRLVVSLGRLVGFKVLAEGVETAGQFDFLREAGVDEAQGFYLSPPLDAGEFRQFAIAHGPWAAFPLPHEEAATEQR